MGKNVHPIYGAGIRTQDLQNMSPPIISRTGLPPIYLDLIVRIVVHLERSPASANSSTMFNSFSSMKEAKYLITFG